MKTNNPGITRKQKTNELLSSDPTIKGKKANSHMDSPQNRKKAGKIRTPRTFCESIQCQKWEH